jgi:hypothetical protein
VERAKSIGFSDTQFRLVVETLHDAAGDGPFGPEPVQDQGSMSAQHACHLLHRLQARAHGALTPPIEKAPGPVPGFVAPEELKVLFEQVGPNRLEVVLQQLGQADLLFFAEVLRALEQQPAAVLEHRLIAASLERFDLGGAYLVDGLAHMGHDVEAVKHMPGLPGLLGNNPQVRLPHVRADELQSRAALGSEPAEEAQQGLDLALLADPQQALAVGVDLVDQRQVAMSALPLHLVHTDGGDVTEILMGTSPIDRHLNSMKDVVPRGLEDRGNLLPTQALAQRARNQA